MKTTNRLDAMGTAALFLLAMGTGPDRESAAVIFNNRMRRLLYHFVCDKLGPCADEWEDAMQSVFVRILKSARQASQNEKEFHSWLFTIARRVCCDMLRGHEPAEPLDGKTFTAPGPGTVTQVRRKERAERLHAAVDRLPAEIGQAVRMVYLKELKPHEVAAQLDEDTRKIQRRAEEGLRRLETMVDPPTGIRRRRIGGAEEGVA